MVVGKGGMQCNATTLRCNRKPFINLTCVVSGCRCLGIETATPGMLAWGVRA